MRVPYIVTHLLDNESKTATLGFLIFGVAAVGLFVPLPGGHDHVIAANDFLLCTFIASTLIGGKLVSEHILEAIAMKLGKPMPAAEPAAPAAAAPPAAA